MGRILKPNEPNVISEPMDGELVVINLESGCYYSLNKAAAKIWTGLEKGPGVEDIIKSQISTDLSEEEIHEKIQTFCDYLLEESLMKEVEGELPAESCEETVYEKPVIEKFSDMQEMLLLDPIHEVSDMGWPNEAE